MIDSPKHCDSAWIGEVDRIPVGDISVNRRDPLLVTFTDPRVRGFKQSRLSVFLGDACTIRGVSVRLTAFTAEPRLRELYPQVAEDLDRADLLQLYFGAVRLTGLIDRPPNAEPTRLPGGEICSGDVVSPPPEYEREVGEEIRAYCGRRCGHNDGELRVCSVWRQASPNVKVRYSFSAPIDSGFSLVARDRAARKLFRRLTEERSLR